MFPGARSILTTFSRLRSPDALAALRAASNRSGSALPMTAISRNSSGVASGRSEARPFRAR